MKRRLLNLATTLSLLLCLACLAMWVRGSDEAWYADPSSQPTPVGTRDKGRGMERLRLVASVDGQLVLFQRQRINWAKTGF